MGAAGGADQTVGNPDKAGGHPDGDWAGAETPWFRSHAPGGNVAARQGVVRVAYALGGLVGSKPERCWNGFDRNLYGQYAPCRETLCFGAA